MYLSAFGLISIPRHYDITSIFGIINFLYDIWTISMYFRLLFFFLSLFHLHILCLWMSFFVSISPLFLGRLLFALSCSGNDLIIIIIAKIGKKIFFLYREVLWKAFWDDAMIKFHNFSAINANDIEKIMRIIRCILSYYSLTYG